MRVLVTRPLEDAQRTVVELKTRGQDALIAPLLEIRFREGPELELDGVQAILATSANGIRALVQRTPRRDLQVFAVGPQTAEAARREGFASVKSADGDAAALADACNRWATPDRGALFHAAGAQTKGGLAERLQALGFSVISDVLYEAVPVPELPSAAAAALREGELDAVLIYSPRSARTFADAVNRAGLAPGCARIAALCISQAAADALEPLTFKAIRVAARPDQDAILALLA